MFCSFLCPVQITFYGAGWVLPPSLKYCGQCQFFKTSRHPEACQKQSPHLAHLWVCVICRSHRNRSQYSRQAIVFLLLWPTHGNLSVLFRQGSDDFPWKNGWTDSLLGYYELSCSGWYVHCLLFNASQIQMTEVTEKKFCMHKYLH